MADMTPTPAEPQDALRALAARWAGALAAERANAQSYIIELCNALGVERPRPAGSDYEFEKAVTLVARDGTETTGFIDCYKRGHFVLEAKDAEPGRSTDVLLRRAYGQARQYAAHDPSGVAPPFLLVLDVGKTMLVWDRFRGAFPGFNGATRIELARLHEHPEHVALLRDIWMNPAARDPRQTAQAVTKELAERLAQLATQLEGRGFSQERVARFVIRSVFTMFAEDVGLLPDEPFRRLIDEVAMADPALFGPAAEALWRAMDRGELFGPRRMLRFNGHFFAEAEALPLTREDLSILLDAARADWAHVEPAIFGTLLVRALDPVERHRLGAEYTPPAYIERLIRPTLEEPIREAWTAVQAEVVQLREKGTKRALAAAMQRVADFHAWLRGLRILDPACGSGNFLYIALHAVKRIELEVIRLYEDLQGGQAGIRFNEVSPDQFYGIEVKPWAREMAELSLWIGHYVFWRQHHDVQPDEPILRDTGNLELRDAVLAWDEIRHDPARDRPDPTPRLRHPVTGELVPDPEARLPYMEYVGARPAAWPEADFIIGNPPYLGEKRQREVFGDGYVEALRAAYPDLSDSADFVTYWWVKAAEAVASGRTIRAGLITTSSLVQAKNRAAIVAAAQDGAHVVWAAPDHPWVDGADGAAVRVAMTVLARDLQQGATLVQVDDDARVTREVRVPRLNADLSAHADVPAAAAVPLRANAGLAWQGYKLVGDGFVLKPEEATQLLAADPRHAEIIKPFRNGRDLAAQTRGVYVIDFGLLDENGARAYPALFDIVRSRVKPDRDAVRDRLMRERWWQFGRPRGDLREAIAGLPRFIVTIEASRRRWFRFLSSDLAPDGALVAIASDDAAVLGVLSSAIHVAWALAAGGRLGVGNDPRYNKTLVFDAFPFPPLSDRVVVDRIRSVADRLEAHRNDGLARDPRVTITGMYEVLEHLEAGRALTPSLRRIHNLAGCGVLRDLHAELDAAVAAAYGWKWPLTSSVILERLVALHDARVAEERAGQVRWIRPEFQQPRYGEGDGEAVAPGLDLDVAQAPTAAAPLPWPADAVQQIMTVRALTMAGTLSVDEILRRLAPGARRDMVTRHLETLAMLGELQVSGNGRYGAASGAAV